MGLVKKIKNIWKSLGPGIVTGAADDDPSGIATYSQAGAGFGLNLLWLAPYTFPLMSIVQEMCARIALVTGRGLAENIRIHFSKKWLYLCGALVVFANTLNIGADLGGMADAIKIFFPALEKWMPILLIALTTIFLEIFLSYSTYAKYLKWLALTVLSYLITMLIIHLDLTKLLYSTFVPQFSLSKDGLFMIAAIIGTTISPYLFFWQTSEEVEEEIKAGDDTVEKRIEDGPKEMRKMRFDTWSGMLFSNIVMYAIIVVCGSTLFPAGISNISGASDAAEALRPLAGNFAYILFTFGILSTGLLAIPVLAGSSAYIIAEALGWREGLYRKPKEALPFYLAIAFSMLFGLLFNFLRINPIKALLYSSVANAIVAPIALIFVVSIASNEQIMGKFKSGRVGKALGWATVALMSVVAVSVFV